MFYRRGDSWYCDCDRLLATEVEVHSGQCAACRLKGTPPPPAELVAQVRAGRVLDARDARWRTACPR